MKYDLRNVKHINKLTRLRYPKDKMLIIGSGIMALLGIKENDDIDIWTTPEILKKMNEDHSLIKTIKHGDVIYETKDGAIEIGGDLPCMKEPLANYLRRAVVISGFRFLSLKDLLAWKTCMGRPKDKIAIKQIQKYLRSSAKENLLKIYASSI